MAVPSRTVSLPAIWAETAQTTIPVPPIKGIGYRNISMPPAVPRAGQLYGSIADSSIWNQYLWQLSSVTRASEVYGIPPYSPLTTYRDKSLTLYTDGRLYRALQDVPTGTPPSNKTYWEYYIPDGVSVTPEVSTSAGLSLYVDYGRTTSGDGLTAATAFKNFSDCFAELRGKYTGVNGFFSSSSEIFLFTIYATGPNTAITIEPGVWRFQSVDIEIVFQKNFIKNDGIFALNSNIKYSGSGSLRVNGPNQYNSTGLILDCTYLCKNSGSEAIENDYGRGMSAISSNIEIMSGGALGTEGVSAFQAANTRVFLDGVWHSTALSTAAHAPCVLFAMSDLSGYGVVSFDAASTAQDNTMICLFVNSAIRMVGAKMYARNLSIQGGYGDIVGGSLWLGSAQGTPPAQGIQVAGGSLRLRNNAQPRIWSQAPVNKGAIAIGGNVESSGIAATSWPGGGSMSLYANGYFTT